MGCKYPIAALLFDQNPKVEPMQYYKPNDAAEAVAFLSGAGGNARVLAGGTDLLVQMRTGRIAPEVIVDIKNIPGAREITQTDGAFTVGAAVSGAEIGESSEFSEAWPGVSEAVQLIGSTQIQGRATMVGNLCNASPAADSTPALIAANAVVNIEGPTGQRQLPVAEFATGPGQTSLAIGEFVASLTFPARRARSADAYLRFIPRTEMDIAVASAGVDLTLDDTGNITHAQVALGAVAATAFLDESTGAKLVGTALDENSLNEMAAICLSLIHI